MNRLRDYIKPHILRMLLGLLIKFIGTIADLLLPLIMAHLLDNVVPLKRVPLIFRWGGAMIVCSAVAVVSNVTANRMASEVSGIITGKIRHDLFKKIMSLSNSNVDNLTIPSLISRLTSDTYNVHHMLGMMQRLGIRAPIMILGGVAVTFSMDPVLTLILIALMPLITIVVFTISRKGIPLFRDVQLASDKMVRTIRENVTGIRVIKALSKTEYEKKRFSQVNEEAINKDKKAGMTMAASGPLMNLFLNLGLCAVVIVGAFRVNRGLTQPGKIIAFLSYFTIILHAMMSISRIFVNLSKGTASYKRIREVLITPQDLRLEGDDIVKDDCHISFENVSFSYNKIRDNITDISFCIKKGETLGIIGATGSGKSTIIKLMMRFYDVDCGVIRIDGRNVKSIPADELYTKFGVVFQNDVLFADSIKENIDFGRGLDDAQIKNATENSQAADFIRMLADGLDHKLTVRGTNLSGGQKQRILIARALAGSPEILILDDSSSALDYKTDAALRKVLHTEFKNTTSIIIAQRISSVIHADHILVLDEGTVLGYGTHNELLESCETYQEISRVQMGGAVNE